jgi:hypothetical protein
VKARRTPIGPPFGTLGKFLLVLMVLRLCKCNTQCTFLFSEIRYLQGPILAFLRTRQYLNETYGECLKLDDSATVQGIGDGGYAAIHLSDALRRFRVRSNKVFIGAAPSDLAKFLADAVAHIDANFGTISEPGLLDKYLMMIYTYSASIVGVNNTGSGISLASDTYRDALVKGLSNPSPVAVTTLLQQLPMNDATTLLNPEFLQFLRRAAATNTPQPTAAKVVLFKFFATP